MAERFALFVIIALGESIVVTGATFSELTWTAETVGAFVSSFVGALTMWWIYFHKGAEAGSEQISRSSEPGRLARLAYTYLHIPIVAGIILAAVADELVLKHPGGHSDFKTVSSAIGGPLLFLLGTILFKHTVRGFLQLSHGAGIIALGVLGWFASGMSPLLLSTLTTAIMVIVALWESISLKSSAAGSRREPHSGAPARER
jgi:low temperature requirement protein LtrA